jgi:hypothetical protein
VFTDCDDPRVLRQVAGQVGALSLPAEHVVSVVKLQEPGTWSSPEQVAELIRAALPEGLATCALLGSGLRSPVLSELIRASFEEAGTLVRLLPVPRLDSYLLGPRLLARVSGAAPEVLAVKIAELLELGEEHFRSALVAGWIGSSTDPDSRAVLSEAEEFFDERWSGQDRRLEVVMPSGVLGEINRWLEQDGYRTVTPFTLARAVRFGDVPPHLLKAILDLDEFAS